MRRQRKVLLAVPSSEYGRGILRGVHTYCQAHEPWQLYLCTLENTPTASDNRRLASLLDTCEPDGVVAAVLPSNLRLFQSCGVPVVNISGRIRTSLPTVMADHAQAGRLAARHLLDRGLRNFAYGCMSKGYFASCAGRAFARRWRRPAAPAPSSKTTAGRTT